MQKEQNKIIKDSFGPEYIIKIYDPKIRMEGILVIDNTVLGPGKGGIRMTPDISEEEIFRLARTMTWKNALAELPFGGAKAGIIWKGGSPELKKKLIQSFAKAIRFLTPKKYIAGPDINTGEKEMQWFTETTGSWTSATGKPENLCFQIWGKPGEKKCGIPHEFGSTGFGIAQATKITAQLAGVDLPKARVAIHGFGNVGSFTFKFLSQMGAKIVALADLSATIFDKEGLDQKIIERITKRRDSLSKYPKDKRIKPEEFWRLPTDILIPASVTDVINEENKDQIKAKIIIEAGNVPMREEIEEDLFKKGILIVPDFIANAGGVISSYAEYRGYHPKRMFKTVETKITKNVKIVLEESFKRNKNPREVALKIARERIESKRSTP